MKIASDQKYFELVLQRMVSIQAHRFTSMISCMFEFENPCIDILEMAIDSVVYNDLFGDAIVVVRVLCD